MKKFVNDSSICVMCNTLRSIHITSLGSNSAQKHLVIGFLHRKVFDNSYYFLVLLVLLKLFMWSWFDLVYGICLKSTLFLHFPNMFSRSFPLHPVPQRWTSKQTRLKQSLSMQSNQNSVSLSVDSQSAFIASQIQSVQFDHMLHHSQSSRPLWVPIRSVLPSQCMDARFICLTFLLMFSLLLLLIGTLEIKSSVPVWVSVSIPIHGQMKFLWWYARYSSV